MVASITDTQGLVALAAAGVGTVALLSCAALAMALSRLRRAQRAVLGERGAQDIVAHSAAMQSAFEELHDYVQEMAERLDERLAGVEQGLTGAISHSALVRYDAYNELSGRQSMSIALLDERRTGIVLSCIHHRDQARVYGKRILQGQGELELSPEEAEAVRQALSPAGGAASGDEHAA